MRRARGLTAASTMALTAGKSAIRQLDQGRFHFSGKLLYQALGFVN
jgi:hypothetical protein